MNFAIFSKNLHYCIRSLHVRYIILTKNDLCCNYVVEPYLPADYSQSAVHRVEPCQHSLSYLIMIPGIVRYPHHIPPGKPGERRGQFLRLVVGKLPARLPVPLLLPDIGVIPPEGRERHELPRPLFPAYRFHAVSLRCVRRLDYCASVRWRAPLNSSPLSVNSSRSAALCRLSHAACSSPFPPPADP